MDPVLVGKLIEYGAQFLIQFLSIVAGGGLIILVIELRRHKREQQEWERQDRLLEIDIPRADIMVSKWVTSDKIHSLVK